VGEAVPVGKPVAGIIPMAEARRIELEAYVSSTDIGRISPGMHVIVKLQPFDWTRYGALEGTVRQVADRPASNTAPAAAESAATRSDPATGAQSYFLVMVALDKDYLGENTRDRRVVPGLTATADFSLGQRTVLADLIDRFGRLIRERLSAR
jgi:multidrug resistance efflux pump